MGHNPNVNFVVFEAVVEGKRPPVESQEGQPEPIASGCPAGDFGVEAAESRGQVDARAVSDIPARSFGAKAFLHNLVQSSSL
jgi:hypothetical protein